MSLSSVTVDTLLERLTNRAGGVFDVAVECGRPRTAVVTWAADREFKALT